MQYKFITIIIPLRNEIVKIEKNLQHIKNLEYPKEYFEVIYVDGLSNDGTYEFLIEHTKDLPNFFIIRNKNKDAASGRNLGIEKSKGHLIAFTDADCYVPKDWLYLLYQKLLIYDDEKLAGIGGKNILPEPSSYIKRSIGFCISSFLGSFGSSQSYFFSKDKKVNSIPNCDLLIKKEVIIKAGSYDSNFKTGQDAELNYRITKMNYYFMFSPDIYVYHDMFDGLTNFIERMWKYGRARIKIMKKYPSSINLLNLLPLFGFICFFTALFISLFNTNLFTIFTIIFSSYLAVIILNSFYITYKRNIGYLLIPGIIASTILLHFSYGAGQTFQILSYIRIKSNS